MSVEVISVTMRLYHCWHCDCWFDVEVKALASGPVHCPVCRASTTVVPFDVREVPLAVADDGEEDGRP